MTTLTSKQLYVTPPTPAAPPAIMVQFVKPVSYEFRVHETVVNGKVTKVKLQVCTWEHDEYGSGTVKQYWSDVPRMQFDETGNQLPSF